MFDSILKPEIILPIMLGINIWIGLDAKKRYRSVAKGAAWFVAGWAFSLIG